MTCRRKSSSVIWCWPGGCATIRPGEQQGEAMPLTAYVPRDPARYPRHAESRVFSPTTPAGVYVYVQDCAGVVWIAPDGFHMHPRVLGRARPVVGAGEVTLGDDGEVLSINNLSGTFQC